MSAIDTYQLHQQTNMLLRNLIIVQLGLAGVGQREIRSILGGSMADINNIVKLIRKSQKKRHDPL